MFKALVILVLSLGLAAGVSAGTVIKRGPASGAGSGTGTDVDNDANFEFTCDSGTSSCAFDPDDDGTAEATIASDGSYTVQDNEATGNNLISVHDHDTDVTPDPTCANKGTAGKVTLVDVDESSSDDWTFCDGTSDFMKLSAGGRVRYAFWGNSVDSADASTNCLASSNRTDGPSNCLTATNIAYQLPIDAGTLLDKLSCTLVFVTHSGTPDSGDESTIVVNTIDDGTINPMTEETCSVSLDLNEANGQKNKYYETDCGREATGLSTGGLVALEVKTYTDPDADVTNYTAVCALDLIRP